MDVIARAFVRWSGEQAALGRVLTIEAEPVAWLPKSFATGTSLTRWSRFDVNTPSGWPPEGRWDTVVLRIPRARVEREMWLEVAGTRLASDGRLVVIGQNDEGVKNVGKALGTSYGRVTLAITKHRCRVFVASDYAGRGNPARAGWIEQCTALWDGRDLMWQSLPGCFAHGRLDAATALLISQLPDMPGACTVLDYGAGAGLLSMAVASRHPKARLTLLDVDAYALDLAAENVSEAERVHSDGFRQCPRVRYDWIVSNPPFHVGSEMSYGPVRDFLEELTSFLMAQGQAWFVVPKTVPVERWVRQAAVRRVATAGANAVWCATHP